jgi:predicted GNAT family acetyltransferase
MSSKAWVYQRLRNIIRIINYYRPKLHREFIYEYLLDNIIDTYIAIEGVILTKITQEQIPDLLEVWNVNTVDMNERLDRGDHCYVVYKEKKAISYHWVQLKGKHFIQPLNQYMTIANNELWIYHVRVSEEYRGQGISGLVYSMILKEFKNKGYKKAWIYTSSTNDANQRSLEKANFQFSKSGISLSFGKMFFFKTKIFYDK